MTNAERFNLAIKAALSLPPEEVKEINRQTRQDYEARRSAKKRPPTQKR